MKKILIFAIAFLVTLTATNNAFAQSRQFCHRVFEASNGQQLPYQVLYPTDFNPNAAYPLLLFLHGAGERGTDNERQTLHGGEMLASNSNLNNVIIVAPQCPEEDYWVNIARPSATPRQFPLSAPATASMNAVKELIDCLVGCGFVDTARIYGTGLSMGAMGILDLTMRFPQLFAAVEPICGGINTDRLAKYCGPTAFRFFHGSLDDVVPVQFSQNANATLLASGVETSLIEYPEANHNSWDSAFAEPTFIGWLLEHRLSEK